MSIQIDYVVAVGFFIIMFAMLVHFTTDYFLSVEDSMSQVIARNDAFSLLSMAERGATWNETDYPSRIGLKTNSFKFEIEINNSHEYYINQSESLKDLENELISFDLSEMGFSNIDLNSTVIYYDNQSIPYERAGANYTFRTDLNASKKNVFTVWFDDDSNFTDESTSVAGNNTLRETTYPVQNVILLQYKKMIQLNSSNYTKMKGNIDVESDFHISLGNILDYGGNVLREENVFSLQRYVLYQNKTGGIERGNLVINVW